MPFECVGPRIGRTRGTWLGFATLSAALAFAPVVARSAEPVGPPPAPDAPGEDAAAKFDRAEELYRDGLYDDAIDLLRDLVSKYPEPILRFNLGRAYESSGQIEEAIAAYEQYLEAAPDASDRDAVVRRIERLRERAKEPEPAAPIPPSDATPSPPPRIIAPWVLTGVGGASLVVGATFGGLALSRQSSAEDAPNQVRASELHDEARTFSTVSTVMLAVGGALAVAGLSWGIAALVKRKRGNGSGSRARLRGATIRF